MNPANLPGFTASSSLSHRHSSHSTEAWSLASRQAVTPQARIGVGGGWGTVGTRGVLGFWCEAGCAAAAALCIAATEGVGVAACIASELTCLASC